MVQTNLPLLERVALSRLSVLADMSPWVGREAGRRGNDLWGAGSVG